MSALPIITVPNETLRNKSREIALDKKTFQFARDLQDTLFAKKSPKGVGLSAPQINKNWNMFITWLNTKDIEKDPTTDDGIIFINPSYIEVSKDFTFGDDPENPILEGCLSIPGLYGPVPRHTEVTVRYHTIIGNEFVEQTNHFTGFLARVIQHEYDHLQGTLFTDYSLEHDLPVYEFVGKKMIEIDKTLLKTF